MVKSYNGKTTSERDKPHLPRSKFLYAAGLTLCNFTATNAADTPNRANLVLPHPPPKQPVPVPVRTGDDHTKLPQLNSHQPLNRQNRSHTSDPRMPPNNDPRPITIENKHVKDPTPQLGQQRRVPQHLQQYSSATQQQQQQQQQQQFRPVSKSGQQSPRAFRSASATPLANGNGQNTFPNRHARSYQSRMMQYPPQHQQYNSSTISRENDRAEALHPFAEERRSREGMPYKQFKRPSPPGSDIRSTRELNINVPMRGTPINNRYNELSDNNFRSEMVRAMDDTKNPVLATVPEASHSQVAIVSSSYHHALLEELSSPAQSLVEAGAWMSFGSILKISWCLLAISLLSYAGVSPSTLPLAEYNLQFYENFRLVCLSTIAPALYLLFVFDPRENDINSVTNIFVVTFFFGYSGIYIMELLATTVLRLLLFIWLEPNVFSLTPKIPIPVLPWVLRELQYRPKRITLLTADFGASCIACPIIEECAKLFLLRRATTLPINFKWVKNTTRNRKSNRQVAEIVRREYGDLECISANQYVTNMLAISVALKLADATRRILLYTKANNDNKGFYAICRGIFPIHELCGAMIAIALAKRDLLGVDIPQWKILGPAIVVHAMANFRGKKPIFKWNSSSPWSEMQLSPLNIPDSSTFFQLVKKGYTKLMWIVTISRVFGYCVKNYYMVNRHALKRTTKYAGNHGAFSAELVTTESLKNLKK